MGLRALGWLLSALLTLPGCDGDAQRLGRARDRSDGKLPELTASRARIPPKIDGVIDVAEWRGAGDTGPFVAPGSGKPDGNSKVKARARVLYDAEQLYVAFEVLDENPTSVFAVDEVDPHVWSRASGVELMVAPGAFSDNRDYFEIQVEVGGAIWDTRFDDYNQPVRQIPQTKNVRFGHQDWKSEIRRATKRESWGYAVEVALPFAALKTPRTPAAPSLGSTWRMNFYSFRDGQSDSLAWSPILGKGNFHRSNRFGIVRFGP
jgi:hypothetical protein